MANVRQLGNLFKASFSARATANGRRGLPFLLRNSPRLFSTEADRMPENLDTDGLYGKLFGITRHAMKSDVVNFLEGCNLKMDDIRIMYNRSFVPMGMVLQFHSLNAYNQANRSINRKGRLYRMERADRTQWDSNINYDGKVLLQGLPRTAVIDDVERFLSGYDYDSSNVQLFYSHNGFPTGMNIFFSGRRPSSSSPPRLLRTLCITSFSSSHPSSVKAVPCLNLLVPPRPDVHTTRRSHLPLIDDLFQISSDVFDGMAPREAQNSRSSVSPENSRKAVVDVVDLSRALSLCASHRNLRLGVQYHCSALTTGFAFNVYVGTSLINLYSKCNDVENAFRVFDEMPIRNVVSWTALITGYAQSYQVNSCFDLYQFMRNSSSEPNDLTIVSLLSACSATGALRQGIIAHCQSIQMGFTSYVHIANALITMYYKSGTVDDASQVFDEMPNRDIVSWNSMITGFSHYGMALEAIDLFDKMNVEKVRPDSITFLGILSSCRHAGLLHQGKFYFDSMVDHGLEPGLDHYCCIVDLLGRSGKLEQARDLIKSMPIPANAIIWGTLLSSCRLHNYIWIGIEAAESRLGLQPDCATTHVQLANLYASVGLWSEAAKIRKKMKNQGLKTLPGYSWVQIGNDVHKFRAEDASNPNVGRVVTVLDNLMDHMRKEFQIFT